MSGHTPGRWQYDEKNDVLFATDPDGMRTTIVEYVDGNSDEEAFANGRLLAAAPTLLQACYDALGFVLSSAARDPHKAAACADRLRSVIDRSSGGTS